MQRKRNRRVLILTAVLAMILAAGAYAYTASINGVSPPNLGSGTGAIGGYTASNISYTLHTGNPTLLDAVSFNLANSTASSSVQISLDGGTTWYSCTMGTPPAVTCATTSPQATAASATNMTIVAQK
jgi:hypothetical protein